MSELAIFGGKPLRTKPFAPWPQYLASDLARVQQVIESRHWGGYPMPSKYGKEFAERFAAMHGAKYGLCVANGTIAIIAALQAAGVGFGDEVIVPAYTWDGTATAVLFCGGVPVFADVDPDTYCLSVKSAHAAVTPRTQSDSAGPSRDALHRYGSVDAPGARSRPQSDRRLRARARRRVSADIAPRAAPDRWATSAASACRKAN